MKYQVRLTLKAALDVDSVLKWFQDQSAAAAGARWLKQLMARIGTLEAHPERCPVAAEASDLDVEIRELGFGRRRGRYRLLFQIRGSTVFVLRVWHSARDAVSRADL